MSDAQPGRCLRIALSVVCALLALPCMAAAAAPPNDDFANARTLASTLPVSDTGTNDEATKEAGEPEPSAPLIAASVWWQWTAPAAGTVTISLCGSDFEPFLAVYTGASIAGLTALSTSDDACAGVPGQPARHGGRQLQDPGQRLRR